MFEVVLNSQLDHSGVAPRSLLLRELCGEDELLDLFGMAGVRLLVERLHHDPRPSGSASAVEGLTLSELDQVCAALHDELYGDTIECKVPCVSCNGVFSVSFSLSALWRSLVDETADGRRALGARGPDSGGAYELSDGTRFRFPTAREVEDARGLDPREALAQLTRRCVVEVTQLQGESLERIDLAMQCLQPRLELAIDDRCPGCGEALDLQFEIGPFLLSALRRERPILVREVHALARAYGWSRAEILSLPRSLRREHVGLVLADAEGASGWA